MRETSVRVKRKEAEFNTTCQPLYQFMQPVHLQLHGFCLGSVAGEVAPKKEAAMSSIRALTDQVFHSLNVKVCTFQSNFVALNGQ